MGLNEIILDKLDDYDITGIDKKDVDALDFSNATDIISELDEIYKNKYKYDLNFAYENASVKIHSFYDDFLIEFDIQRDKYKSSDTEDHHISRFVDRLYKHIRNLHIHYRWLNLSILFTSLLLSLALILSIHWLTDHFIHRFEALIDSFVIVFVLGVVKVFFEERILREKIEERGWIIYKKSIELSKSNFAKVILSYLLLKKANESGKLLKQLVGKHRKFLRSLYNYVDYEPDE